MSKFLCGYSIAVITCLKFQHYVLYILTRTCQYYSVLLSVSETTLTTVCRCLLPSATPLAARSDTGESRIDVTLTLLRFDAGRDDVGRGDAGRGSDVSSVWSARSRVAGGGGVPQSRSLYLNSSAKTNIARIRATNKAARIHTIRGSPSSSTSFGACSDVVLLFDSADTDESAKRS